MSRLIDADDFEKFIKEKYKDGESTDDIKDQMLFDLSYQPTAFDTEQVIHNLECEKTVWVGKKITTTEVMKIDDAIDIVKKGGVE